MCCSLFSQTCHDCYGVHGERGPGHLSEGTSSYLTNASYVLMRSHLSVYNITQHIVYCMSIEGPEKTYFYLHLFITVNICIHC